MKTLRGLLLGLAFVLAGASARAEQVVVYRGATVIDGTGAPPRPSMAVIVKGERIEQVAPAMSRTAVIPP